ncbi:endo alpha-1,4 polygalactosaminidase [Nocardioides sp. KIGAM211]|uniref:Endo alpha-1,4 polygalactosaminidase n=1 Tax=Nocardioides luti TaxID=2761101 RepID=A0A7X0RLL3_9ACTN|nr:endo alpha-1,4 polygalactosaminidase [Nocardioides luti]MBB6629243.1 endo alpha-1,4 polygalactosaminidase [Nocardioides luti]
MRRPARFAARLVALVLLGSGLAAAPAYAVDPTLPPVGTDFDYQLGGNRPVPDRVGIEVRDRGAAPADGLYNVCYVNGFQTQEDEKDFWREQHWDLVLKDDGRAVVDEGWGEWVLDLRTPAKRRALARIVGRWVAGCADDGFAGVELDNLDSYSRSHGLISRTQTKKYAALLVRRAHRAGLAVAQKNMAQWDGTTVGFDFAIAEECAHWRECGSYVEHYGRHVLAVEYTRKDFRRACRTVADEIAVVRRDVPLSPHGVRRWC